MRICNKKYFFVWNRLNDTHLLICRWRQIIIKFCVRWGKEERSESFPRKFSKVLRGRESKVKLIGFRAFVSVICCWGFSIIQCYFTSFQIMRRFFIGIQILFINMGPKLQNFIYFETYEIWIQQNFLKSIFFVP